jgi:predicted RNase H-like HicB family nuclease
MEAYHDGEKWCARGIGVDVFTQGDTLDELMENIKEAVTLHFEGSGEVTEVLVISEVRVPHAEAAAS